MRKLLALSAAVFLAGNLYAVPQASPGTLADYIATGSEGVMIGATRFSDFMAFEGVGGVSPIAPELVIVTPFGGGGNAGFTFSFDAAAGAGELVGLKLAFNVHSSALSGAAISLLGSDATGDGVATGVEQLGLDDAYNPFTGDPPGVPLNLIAFRMATDSELVSSESFQKVSLLGVGGEFIADGGLAGSSQLDGVRLSFVVPEEASAWSLVLALAVLAFVRRLMIPRLRNI